METWRAVGGDEDSGQWVGHDASTQFPVYTRGNAGEVYPEVFTPLSFSLAAEAGERAMRAALLSTGLVRPKELASIPISTGIGNGVFGGYAYLNLSMLRMTAARLPGGSAGDADANYLGSGDPPPHEPLPGEKNLWASLAGLRHLRAMTKQVSLPILVEDQRLADTYLAELPNVDLATDSELWAAGKNIIPVFEQLFERHLQISFSAGLAVAALSAICEQQLGDANLTVTLLAGLGDVDSAAPAAALWGLSRSVEAQPAVAAHFDEGPEGLWARLNEDETVAGFVDAVNNFLHHFGSRGPNEWDTAFDTWGTDPDLALTLVDRMRGAEDSHDPLRQQQRLAEEAAAAETEAAARLPRRVRGLFQKFLATSRLYSRSRERSKTTVIRAIHGSRLMSMELDRRLVKRSDGTPRDLWFLVESEIAAYMEDPGSLADVINERREQHARLAERVPPFFFSGSQPPLDQWELRTADREPLEVGASLNGLPGCPGVARGRARVVTDPGDPGGLGPGDVLVAPLTDPAWTPLFVPAAAVVVDVGAIMSHAVIVSRELGIPCVVSATDATKRIADGTLIEVDGAAGTVTVIEEP